MDNVATRHGAEPSDELLVVLGRIAFGALGSCISAQTWRHYRAVIAEWGSEEIYGEHWVADLGLDRADYGTHSMRRTKATLIYRRTRNLRTVQLLLGHSKLESAVRYIGIEVDDALEISEQMEI